VLGEIRRAIGLAARRFRSGVSRTAQRMRQIVGRGAPIVTALLVASHASAAEVPPVPPPGDAVSVTIVTTSAGALSLSTMEPQLDWPIVIRRNDSLGGPRDIRVDITNLVSPSGRLETVKLQKDGADFAGTLTLQPLGQQILHLVGRVPEEGAYTAEIGLIIDGKRQSIAVSIKRTVREVVIAGASGGALQLTTPDPDLNWPIIIRRNDNADNAREVGVQIGPLTAPSGRLAPLALRGGTTAGTVSLRPVDQATLTLVGQLTEEGTYTGEIALVVDGKRLPTALKITRTLKDSAVRIEDISQVETTLDSTGVRLLVRLQESEGQRTTINLPEIVRLDRKDGGAAIQAQYRPIDVLAGDKKISGPMVLEPNRTATLTLLIAGLDDPGNYSGTVRVSSPARKVADKPFELSLRRWIGVAVGLILLGVLLSTGVRLYVTIGRPTLVAQTDALDVRDDLARLQANTPDLNPEEQRVLATLLDRLDAIGRGTAATTHQTLAEQVDEIRRKVPVFVRWVELRRRLAAVNPPDLRDAITPRHQAIGPEIELPGTNKEGTDALLTELDKLNNDLTATIKDHLEKSIRALRDRIGDPKAAPAALLAVADTLDKADERAGAGNFREAATLLDEARRLYAGTLIKALQTELDTGKPAAAFDATAWPPVVVDARGRLNSILAEPDAAKQVNDWELFRRGWLLRLMEPLAREVDGLINEAEKRVAAAATAAPPPGATKIDPVAAKKHFETARDELNKIPSLLMAGKVQDAYTSYATAVGAYVDGKTNLTGARMSAAAAGPSTPLPTTDVPPSVIEAAWRTITFGLGAPATRQQAFHRLVAAELLLFVILLVTALFLGLKLLYFENAAWGSCTDLVVAVLWGFGLHQVGGSAFQGVQGMVQQIVRGG
jgi:hypothetical protein